MRLFNVDKKVLSWALYDWANSSFATTVMAAFLPVFLSDYWSTGVDPTVTTARLGVATSTTAILVALMTPTLGALSDLRGSKKLFCFIFMLMGALACLALAFIGQGQWLTALLVFGVAMMGFNASVVFYDSLLPSVAKGESANYVSSLGYSLGYLGGGLLFLLNVIMTLKPHWFGIPNVTLAVKFSFASVAIWWLVFSIPLFKNVPEPAFEVPVETFFQSLRQSLQQLKSTFKNLLLNKNLLIFLIAFWLYIDGVYTVMTMAVDYGKALKLGNADLMGALLITQFVAFPFALLFSKFSERMGQKKPILIAIGIYSITVIFATWMSEAWHFYTLAIIIGMVQGGVQALSRSLFSHLIPPNASGEYFALYNLVGKFASILGPLLVGMSAYISGNSRFGLMSLLVLFAIGGGLLLKVQEPSN